MAYKRKVLIVDDQKINRSILKKILESDFDIIQAENGRMALDILKANVGYISAVVLDIMMPIMDGYAVLDSMRQDPELMSIPVVVATQSDEDLSELNALNHGASDFVSKPYNGGIIKKRLSNLIQMREANDTIDILERDKLTGMFNKEGFQHKVSEIIKGDFGTKYDIVSIDIENFKLVNDTYGVETGDRLLIYIAELMKACDKKNGSLSARAYGDQFFFIMKRDIILLKRIMKEFITSMEGYELEMKLKLNFGVYQITDTTTPVQNMCDRALIAVKLINGQYEKNCSYYDDSIIEKLLLEQQITDDMDLAIEQNQFKVYFQPKYDISTNTIAGAEALVRWIHPEKGFMSPGDFIPVFEKNGFITNLDTYVWDKTCQYISKWKKEFNTGVPVSVNVSRKDIYKHNLPKLISAMTEKYGIEKKDLHLEITESAYTENQEQLINVVNNLKAMGFVIEMDDFGSGYSSLNMLAKLPIDILKMDMKFVQTEADVHVTRSIMSCIISLAKVLNLKVIAEGVETKEQVDMLHAMGCDYVQGYYFAKPMPAEDFLQKLLDEKKS